MCTKYSTYVERSAGLLKLRASEAVLRLCGLGVASCKPAAEVEAESLTLPPCASRDGVAGRLLAADEALADVAAC